jgi:uncharacterized protein YgiB involved in biofilm formation
VRRITVTILLLSTVVLAGCKKQIACDPADSQAVCKGFEDCLHSDMSAEVCRMAEQDANKIQKGTVH